jgi:hypothetical protein
VRLSIEMTLPRWHADLLPPDALAIPGAALQFVGA